MAKKFLACKVLSVTPVSADIFRLDCDWPGTTGDDPQGGAQSGPLAGQFFMVKPENSGVFLPRPISAALWDPGTLSFLILRRGKGTEELAQLHPGQTIELSGPLGNCWEDFLPPEEKPCALIGGGIGIAPLLSLPLQHPSRFDFYAGFRTLTEEEETALLGPIKPHVNKLTIATEIDRKIKKPRRNTEFFIRKSSFLRETPWLKILKNRVSVSGRIPDFLNPADYSAVCACGPEAMLRAVAEKCAVAGVPCYVSLERRMACGAGACLGCTVATSQGNRRCCADGPIFPADTVIF